MTLGAVDPDVGRARATRLATGIAGPFNALAKRMVIGFFGSAAIALVIGTATGQPLVGAVAGLVLATIVAVMAWTPLSDPAFRAATELYYDHDCHERDRGRLSSPSCGRCAPFEHG